MDSMQSGHAVQVVSVEADGTYTVDLANVERITSACAELPACVVSVAGATRGGKSFLLDFFLRYLHASEQAREDGSWIGADDEPLTGFSWRGGADRDTTGIQIWSEPIVMTLESGERVAVLLMDTQGTFDSQSTFRDSTTVFALSTLLSSVQIYNLFQNIKEDDLQYLQYFTEYGKLLLKENSSKPFQVLQFLVRDWSYGYQYSTDAAGGQAFLEKRLKVENSQAAELREVREHIKSSFEAVKCNLMPHPGLIVANDPDFKGCLSDISKEFKNCLVKLVPALFDAENLVLKRINGQIVTTQELLQYFNAYVNIFNSEELPSPVSILKATSEACLEIAVSKALSAYDTQMHAACVTRVPAAAVPRLHAAARDHAQQLFTARRTLAAPADITRRLQNLLHELDTRLAHYVEINETKLREAFADAEAVYEERFRVETRCLSEDEIEELHREAVAAALDRFDSTCPPLVDDTDSTENEEDKRSLNERLEELGAAHRVENASRIVEAVERAKSTFESQLLEGVEWSRVCLPPVPLAERQRRARLAALAVLDAAWRTPDHAHNDHKTQLANFINTRWSKIEANNKTNNSKAVSAAAAHFTTLMADFVSCDKCIHPMDLLLQHKTAKTQAFAHFNEQRTQVNEDDEMDLYEMELQRVLNSHVRKNTEINETKNSEAVERAHKLYKSRMNIIEGAEAVSAYLMAPDLSVLGRHEQIKTDVVEVFLHEYRRRGAVHETDVHLNKLNELINETYVWLTLKVVGGVAFQVANVGLLASLIMRR